MKKCLRVLSVFIGLTVNSGMKAFANDTSFPTIEVDEIETDTAVGSHISFVGEEARKLMQVLPPISSVLGKESDSHHRQLEILSPGYMVSINCRDTKDRMGKISVVPHCSIWFDHRMSESPMNFEPNKQCRAE